jgi:hypothetical protein
MDDELKKSSGVCKGKKWDFGGGGVWARFCSRQKIGDALGKKKTTQGGPTHST